MIMHVNSQAGQNLLHILMVFPPSSGLRIPESQRSIDELAATAEMTWKAKFRGRTRDKS
ncbi:hypothetical protein [Desulfovibrio aminophilus]|uniref:hypothetical protein n=1 Tax=Desulfovibrio aminophilus TaxID=81425 RepID=UPI0033920B8C